MEIKTREELVNEIMEVVPNLDRYRGYTSVQRGTEDLYFFDEKNELAVVFDCGEAAEEALQYYAETGNAEAEVRYDGIKYFTIELVK